MSTYAENLAAFAGELCFEDLPAEVVTSAKLHILDTVGVCLATASLPSGRSITDLVRQWGGTAESTVIGFGPRLPAPSAALANGTLAHGTDFDDTHTGAMLHPSASIVPAALALGEATNASGRDMIAAAVAGYEVMMRIGLVAPGVFHANGLHTTPIAGCFASALVAGKLLGLSQSELVAALGICGSQAMGLQEFLAEGSSVKQLHPGWAAHSGIVAAQLAQHGFAGPSTVFEGRFGTFRSLLRLEPSALAPLTAGLGSVWETARIAFKPYPCCHFNHASADAALALKREMALNPDEIAAVECLIIKNGIPIVCEPIETKRRPRSTYDARFSLPYVVAVALCQGAVRFEHFYDPFLEDPAILALAQNISCSIDPKATTPVTLPGEVRITLADGRVVGRRMDCNRGGPENPWSVEEVEDKFFANATKTLSRAQAEAVVRRCHELDALESARQIADVLSSAHP